jgi:hypothetical protein
MPKSSSSSSNPNDIHNHGQLPIYSAGSDDSRHATLTLSSANRSTAWIDVYYTVSNTPLDLTVEILDENGTLVASLDLVEDVTRLIRMQPSTEMQYQLSMDLVIMARRKVNWSLPTTASTKTMKPLTRKALI